MIRPGMFSMRALTAAGVAALSIAPVSAQEKPPVYPQPDTPATVVETTTELERQISGARAFVQSHTHGLLRAAREGVDRAIATESHVESRITDLIAKDEHLTPNGFYVAIATLAGRVFTRHRAFPIRWLAPPVVFFAAMSYWLPHTTANLGRFYEQIEGAHFPQVTEHRVKLTDTLQSYYSRAVAQTTDFASTARAQVASGVAGLEKNTGLRLGTVAPVAPVHEAPKEEPKKLV